MGLNSPVLDDPGEATLPISDDGVANTPKLAEVEAPWPYGKLPSPAEMPKLLPALIRYQRIYGPYFVPESLDSWEYRRTLRGLDPACLDAFSVQGALSKEELTEWLSQEGVLKLVSAKTGIRRVTAATTRDWVETAMRRGVIARWTHDSDPNSQPRWVITEQGREELLTPLQRLAKSVPLIGLLSIVFGGGAVFGWIGSNGVVLAFALAAVGLGIYALALWLLMHRNLRREGPGAAVVAIETLRSSGTPLPSFGSST